MKWNNAETYLLNLIYFKYPCVCTAGLESVGHITWKLITKKLYFLHINIHIK